MSLTHLNIPHVGQTVQTKIWQGEFGRAYTDRNTLAVEELDALWMKNYGVSRSEVTQSFVSEIPKNARILEVGCNVGNQLLLLQKEGFTDLTGVEIQPYAVTVARSRVRDVVFEQASVLALPFEDESFDLVFTSGVLIHIAPQDLPMAMKEIRRCTRRYIWGTEYFSAEPESVTYRGHESLLWKTDYAGLYLSSFPDLCLVRERRLQYLENENVDTVFLLKKRTGERTA